MVKFGTLKWVGVGADGGVEGIGVDEVEVEGEDDVFLGWLWNSDINPDGLPNWTKFNEGLATLNLFGKPWQLVIGITAVITRVNHTNYMHILKYFE